MWLFLWLNYQENSSRRSKRSIYAFLLLTSKDATLDAIRQAFPIPMGPPGATVSHLFTHKSLMVDDDDVFITSFHVVHFRRNFQVSFSDVSVFRVHQDLR